MPLRGVSGNLAEREHCTVLARLELQLLNEPRELDVERIPAAELFEVGPPDLPERDVLRELT